MLIFFHLAVSSLVLAPSFHDEGVVDRDAHNLVDALGFNIGGSLNVARQMGLAAARGESSRHSKNNDLGLTSQQVVGIKTSENLFASAELCKFDFVARGVLKESDRGDLVPDGDRSHGGEVEIARFERRRELSRDQPGNAVHV